MIEGWQEGYMWLTGLELLSLDFLRPVYPDLGVGITREETVRGLARDAILRHLSEQDNTSPQSPEGMERFLHSQVEALIRIAGSALGDGAPRALTHWIQFVQSQESANPWTRYQDALTSWASNLRRSGVDVIGFSFDSGEIAAKVREAASPERVRRILEQQRRAPLTPWDFPLFKDRGVLDLAHDSPFFPFVDAVRNFALTDHRFQAKAIIDFIPKRSTFSPESDH